MTKRKLAATKKNCAMFNEETLTFDFIYRAFKNNPLEFLNNEELDMILLFASGETYVLKVLYAVYKTTTSFNPFSKDSLLRALTGSSVTEEELNKFWQRCFFDSVQVKIKNAYYAAFCLSPHQCPEEKLCVFACINNKEIRNNIWDSGAYKFNLEELTKQFFPFSIVQDKKYKGKDERILEVIDGSSAQISKHSYAILDFNLKQIDDVGQRADEFAVPFERVLSSRFFNNLDQIIKIYSEHTDSGDLDYVNNLNHVLKEVHANGEELNSLVSYKKDNYEKISHYRSEIITELYGRMYSLVYNKSSWANIFNNFGARLDDGSLLNENWIIKLFYVHPYSTYSCCSTALMRQGRDFAPALYASSLPNKIKNNLLVGLIKRMFHGVYLGDISSDSSRYLQDTKGAFEYLFLTHRGFTTDPNLRQITHKFYYDISSLFPKKTLTLLAGEKELWDDLDFIHSIKKAQRIHHSNKGYTLRGTPRCNTAGRYAIAGVPSPLDVW
jgi:hypothetical protein